MSVVDTVVKALAQGTGAGPDDDAPKLFLLLAVRSSEDVLPSTMARWVAEAPFVTHMRVGPLAAEAARELASAVARDGKLPEDVLDCAPAPPRPFRAPPVSTRQASTRAVSRKLAATQTSWSIAAECA